MVESVLAAEGETKPCPSNLLHCVLWEFLLPALSGAPWRTGMGVLGVLSLPDITKQLSEWREPSFLRGVGLKRHLENVPASPARTEAPERKQGR